MTKPREISRSRRRRHKTKRNQQKPSLSQNQAISSRNQAKSAEPDLMDSGAVSQSDHSIMDSGAVSHGDHSIMDSGAVSHGDYSIMDSGAVSHGDHSIMDSGAVSHADEVDKGNKSSNSKVITSYPPISFYLDSAVNHTGPIRNTNKMDKCISKNCLPLSLYTTALVYHPALDPMGESWMDIFVSMEEYLNHTLSSYMDPTLSYQGRKNYIPLSMPSNALAPMDMRSKSSQSKVRFHFKLSQSKFESNIIFGSFGSQADSSKSKVSRNSIPDKVAFSILSKLPIKSMKRFECLCKSYSILFENTDFMTMYHKHFISRHGSDSDYHAFLLINRRRLSCVEYRYHSDFFLLDRLLEAVILDLPYPLLRSGDPICILGSTSVNGIFCLGQYNRRASQVRYALWNPLTDEFMVIPSSPTQLIPNHPSNLNVIHRHYVFHGFGHDQFRDDLKLIQYVSYDSSIMELKKSFLEIYSLKSNSWRFISMDNDDLSHWDFLHSKSFAGLEVYVDGACHWLVSDPIDYQRQAMTLLSFDLSREVFITTPIGEEPYCPYTLRACLMQLNGSVALISNYHDDIVFHISILGEVGVSESWIKLYVCDPLPSIRWPPIGFGKMGCIFFKKKDYEFACVDLSTQTIEEVGINIGKHGNFISGLYKGSLLSIRGSSN